MGSVAVKKKMKKSVGQLFLKYGTDLFLCSHFKSALFILFVRPVQ
jgi:hypothetical protein